MRVDLPLTSYRFHPQKPVVTIDAATRAVTFYLPGYFGRRRWTVHLDEIGVVDLMRTRQVPRERHPRLTA